MKYIYIEICKKLDELSNHSKNFSLQLSTRAAPICTDTDGTGGTVSPVTLNDELIEMLAHDKKLHKIKERCKALKPSIALFWHDQLKKRDKHYRNFIKNANKAQLYDDWAESSPE